MDKKEMVFTVLLITTGVAGLIYSISLPTMGAFALSPGLFPGVVTMLMIVLGSVHLFGILRSDGSQQDSEEDNKKRSFLVIFAFFVLYLLLLSYIHFIISTIVFLLATMFFLYKRFYWKIPVITVITVFVIYYLFRYILKVRLP